MTRSEAKRKAVVISQEQDSDRIIRERERKTDGERDNEFFFFWCVSERSRGEMGL